jgi:uncharacterized protein YjgD (DUF1641 family)
MIKQDIPWEHITHTRKDIIEKKAEIESISDRIVQLEKEGEVKNFDDLHKARMKQKHTKETLVDLQKEATEHDVLLTKAGLASMLPYA